MPESDRSLESLREQHFVDIAEIEGEMILEGAASLVFVAEAKLKSVRSFVRRIIQFPPNINHAFRSSLFASSKMHIRKPTAILAEKQSNTYEQRMSRKRKVNVGSKKKRGSCWILQLTPTSLYTVLHTP